MRAANLDPNDPLVRSAVFGEQVQEFLRSPVGDYLVKRAEAGLAAALGQLKTVSASETVRIIALQQEIQFLERFEGWLGDAVQSGLTAIAVIDGEENIDA